MFGCERTVHDTAGAVVVDVPHGVSKERSCDQQAADGRVQVDGEQRGSAQHQHRRSVAAVTTRAGRDDLRAL
jgi:hypothetical protein